MQKISMWEAERKSTTCVNKSFLTINFVGGFFGFVLVCFFFVLVLDFWGRCNGKGNCVFVLYSLEVDKLKRSSRYLLISIFRRTLVWVFFVCF